MLDEMARSASSRGLTRRQVVEVQRARLVSAAIEVVGDGGYASLTVASTIQRARVSRKTFYEVFTNSDECFEAAFEDISARGLAAISAVAHRQSGWLATIRACLGSLLSLIDEQPALARIWFVESLAGPTSVLERRARAMAGFADVVHAGREEGRDGRSTPHLIAEASVGGVAHLIHSRLIEGSTEPFAALSGPLTYLIVLPYLGRSRASAELSRSPSARKSAKKAFVERPSLDESLRGLSVRLTYRTIRAMNAVHEHPGASNLEISGECGIKDQGQMSKLLSRLDRHGLIENRGLGQDRGAPNSWYTTESGSRLVQATRAPDALAGTGRRSTGRAGSRARRI